jgi:pantetheine-phosphate adenylyltransferase
MKIAIYPGSFDPTTNGHMDIIMRASSFVDKLIVGVLENPSKTPVFTTDERVEQLKLLTADMPNVEVMTFSGLTVDFARSIGASLIIRGLRAVTDFEYEFQMALTNRNLAGEIETLFIPTSSHCLYLSSSMVKEIALFGGNIDDKVPAIIRDALLDKYADRRKN